jgi:hypothetical protein
MLSFGPPLPVGLLSTGEYVDVFTAYHYTGNIVRDLGTFLPRGLRITEARPIPREAPSLGRIVNLARYEMTIPAACGAEVSVLAERGRSLAGVREILPGPGRTIVLALAIEAGIKLFDVLAALFEIGETEARCVKVTRRDCLAAQNGRIRTPMED